MSIFAEIFVTTAGAFGTKTLTYLIFQRVLESQNVGLGSAGGVYAIILANIVAIFLMRAVGDIETNRHNGLNTRAGEAAKRIAAMVARGEEIGKERAAIAAEPDRLSRAIADLEAQGSTLSATAESARSAEQI